MRETSTKEESLLFPPMQTIPSGVETVAPYGTRQSVDLFPAFGKKDEYLAIISLGSSLGDGFVRKVATSGNDQYAVMDAGERGGNAKGSRIGCSR